MPPNNQTMKRQVLFGTVFQTAVLLCFMNPETSYRVTLASLGTVFQTDLVVLLSCCLVVLLTEYTNN